MRLTVDELARMMDLSAVRTDVTLKELRHIVDVAVQRNVICVFPMPCYMAEVEAWLAESPEVGLGGVVGFPSGAVATATKVAEVRQHLEIGANELDMVINVGLLKSGQDDRVRDDIRAVVDAADGTPVKVILEVH